MYFSFWDWLNKPLPRGDTFRRGKGLSLIRYGCLICMLSSRTSFSYCNQNCDDFSLLNTSMSGSDSVSLKCRLHTQVQEDTTLPKHYAGAMTHRALAKGMLMFMQLLMSYEYSTASPSESGEGGVENYRIKRAYFPSAPSPDGKMVTLDYWTIIRHLRTKVRIIVWCVCLLTLILLEPFMAQGQS